MIFDEADAVLDSGNYEAVSFFMRIVVNQKIIDKRGSPARAFFVSATLNGSLNSFLDEIFLNEEIAEKVGFEKLIDNKTHLNLSHVYHNFVELTQYDKHK